MSDDNDSLSFPLNQLERRARSHAILSTIGFLILLPIGVLVARYTRTLPYKQVFRAFSEKDAYMLTNVSHTLLSNQNAGGFGHIPRFN